ncbi:hypothetical protein PIB30_068363 [Stylosanthes scabra]|uniref:Uncharacterized protein n=1 Tax=Stylosanthes scabra TaxID=79078 RepID=A0ABU6XKN9_9FABA|nr:hypothetical protein [Stylosanthes scabra]
MFLLLPRISVDFHAYAWVFILGLELGWPLRAFHAYAWVFYAYPWMNEVCGSQGHIWACLYVTLERELLASHAYVCLLTHMCGKDEAGCHA